ncbi:MAG: fibronectin type III domain-containing protein [Melioribacteraceae bacterium]|nr:fibronectin type III domain-containing protein [Melioribacteraceae bacterium]
MKKIIVKLMMAALLAASLLLTSCDEEYYYDSTPPEPPTNVVTITGDNWVEVQWDHSRDRDVAGYNVYYNYTYDGRYTLIGSTESDYFVDYDALNGETYFYAVAAYDYDGNESELSYDYVKDTPRPEGYNRAIFEYISYPEKSGYDFSDYSITPYNSEYADFFFEEYNGVYYINVWWDTDLQDMGATYDIYDVTEAPVNGWIPLHEDENVKYTEAIPGHTYVIWTYDDHYAKVRINSIQGNMMVFDWAYQTVNGERELKRGNRPERNGEERVVIKRNR